MTLKEVVEKVEKGKLNSILSIVFPGYGSEYFKNIRFRRRKSGRRNKFVVEMEYVSTGHVGVFMSDIEVELGNG